MLLNRGRDAGHERARIRDPRRPLARRDPEGENFRAAGGLKPDPLMTVSEWADRYRMLSSRAAAEPGRYRTKRTPDMKEIMDALSLGASTVTWWAVPETKSELQMTPLLVQLSKHIHDLQAALEDELEEKRRAFRYQLEQGRVVFDAEAIARHRAARERLASFLARTRPLVVLTAPVIYLLIVPLALLDAFVMLYQAVCFPVYGIPKVRRREHIVVDRQHLAYLNGLQKLNCVYCGYANGLVSFVREVAARTEAHWCPIKHSRRVAEPHSRYVNFVDFGDERDFQQRVADQRLALKRGTGPD
jgi:hypothetical protein